MLYIWASLGFVMIATILVGATWLFYELACTDL